MQVEKQVITIDQAKHLKELGINTDSAYYWVFDSGMKWRLFPEGYFYKEEEGIEYYPAYTVAELGVMIPKFYDGAGRYYTIQDEGKSENGIDECGFSIWELLEDYDTKMVSGSELVKINKVSVFTTEAMARGALLIHLVESGITTTDEVNARLSNG